MSTLKLNLNGSSEPLVNYLKSFAKIQNSLLLEIDTDLKAFVAKIFTKDRGAIRFSSISFEDCSISIVSDTSNDRGSNRIKAGILIQLSKFIKMIERFGADVDKETNNSDFIIRIEYDALNNGDNTDYIATVIAFENSYLKMKMDGFKLSELFYLPDVKFKNDIFNVDDPVRLSLSADTLNSVIKALDIVKVDPLADIVRFYVEDKDVFVCDAYTGIDAANAKEPNFVYKLGTLEADPGYPISAVILREKFIQMVDKGDKGFTLILGHRKNSMGEYMVDRILFDSEDGMTKVVIGIQVN